MERGGREGSGLNDERQFSIYHGQYAGQRGEYAGRSAARAIGFLDGGALLYPRTRRSNLADRADWARGW